MPAKKPAMRQHPIALGRGAKWWREQVRRNVSAIFDGLVRKGAKADRATMSRAYAFAIGSLVKHGYLKRTEKGLMVTDKGVARSREKLRTAGARKKHEHFEKQLALVRKGPARRPADKRKTRRNAAPGSRARGMVVPSTVLAAQVVRRAGGQIPPPLLRSAALRAQGWEDADIATFTDAQAAVLADGTLYELSLLSAGRDGSRVPDPDIALAIAKEVFGGAPSTPPKPLVERLRKEGWSREMLSGTAAQMLVATDADAYYRALRVEDERERTRPQRVKRAAFIERGLHPTTSRPSITRLLGMEEAPREPIATYEMSEFGQRFAAEHPEIMEAFRRRAPADAEAAAEARRMAALERREVLGRPGWFRVKMAQEVLPTGVTRWILLVPTKTSRTGASVALSKVGKRVRMLRLRDEIEPIIRRRAPEYDEYTGPEQIDAVMEYARQYKHKYADIKVSQSKLTVEEIALGLAMVHNPGWPTVQSAAGYLDEATRLFMVAHTRGGKIGGSAVPGGWDFVWGDNVTGLRVYTTESRAAAANAQMQMEPLEITNITILPEAVRKALAVQAGSRIGEAAKAEQQRRVFKTMGTAARRREEAKIKMALTPEGYAELDPEEQRSLVTAAARRARGGAEPAPRGPRPSLDTFFREAQSAVQEQPEATSSGKPNLDDLFAVLRRNKTRRNRR